MFICVPQINFIIHFFLKILYFKESWNLISQQDFGTQFENQNFARYGIGGEISITILVFILDYFQEKLWNFSKKIKNYFRAILGPIWSILGKNKFSWKTRLCQFLNIPIIYHHAKNQKKTNEPFLRKMPNWQMDGLTDNSDFIGPLQDGGPAR